MGTASHALTDRPHGIPDGGRDGYVKVKKEILAFEKLIERVSMMKVDIEALAMLLLISVSTFDEKQRSLGSLRAVGISCTVCAKNGRQPRHCGR